MDYWFLWFSYILAINCQVSSLPAVCYYNGTAYSEEDLVKTEEPCLSCICRGGSLVCNLKICPDFPDVLPPGCFIVHKANACCPQLLCGETETPNGVEVRTNSAEKYKIVENGCFINGSIYAEGSAVAASEFCEYCYCIGGEVKCIKPRCFQPFKGCQPLYKEPSCCPTHYDCREVDVGIPAIQNNSGCEYEGIHYNDGAKIEMLNISSKCETCYCVKGEIRCAPIICPTDSFGNCQPVNSSDQCCPITFKCEKILINTTSTNISTSLHSKAEGLHNNSQYGHILKNSNLVESASNLNERKEEENSTVESPIPIGIEESTPTIPWDGEERFAKLDNFTFISFQETTTMRNFKEITEISKEITTTTMTAINDLIMTSKSPFSGVNFKKKVLDQRKNSESQVILDDTSGNSSQNSDDYDSYDYNEPKLPPSLPNLVIFPFVAADAVVRDEKTTESEIFDQNIIKRIDTQGTYYNDFFSPPVQTEGGFVPKKPVFSFDPFYKNSYFNKGEKFTLTSNIDKAIGASIITKKNESNFSSLTETYLGIEPQTVAADVLNVTPNPFSEVIKTEPAPDLSSASEPARLRGNHSTLKPVTVTYKNVVVDYYPDYLITSSRNYLKVNSGENLVTEEKIDNPVYLANSEPNFTTVFTTPSQNLHFSTHKKSERLSSTIPESTALPIASEASLVLPEEIPSTIETMIPTITSNPPITSEASFLDEFFKSLLSEEVKPITKNNNKNKFSSKIKASTVATIKSFPHNVTERTKFNTKNSINNSYSLFELLFNPEAIFPSNNSSIENNKGEASSEKKILADTINASADLTTIKPLENQNENVPDFKSREESQGVLKNHSEHKKFEKKSTPEMKQTSNLGNLLKLAGCNIYGKMYRVGKIIMELSGPCLECVCTDLGVQCKSMKC